jgi:hypothetical protein
MGVVILSPQRRNSKFRSALVRRRAATVNRVLARFANLFLHFELIVAESNNAGKNIVARFRLVSQLRSSPVLKEQAARAKPEEVLDLRFVEDLKKSGFLAQLGAKS